MFENSYIIMHVNEQFILMLKLLFFHEIFHKKRPLIKVCYGHASTVNAKQKRFFSTYSLIVNFSILLILKSDPDINICL